MSSSPPNPDATSEATPEGSEEVQTAAEKAIRGWRDLPGLMQITVVVGSVFTVPCYLVWPVQFGRKEYLSVLAAVLMTVAAAFTLAAVLGLVFGIPRAATLPKATARLLPNTNLEQVSDCLTKLLIGAGLVQIGSFAGALGKLAEYLKPALGNSAATPAFAAAIIQFNLAAGFATGYISTRLVLTRELRDVEDGPNEQVDVETAESPAAAGDS